uniref:Ribosomal protein L16 n=1 Tax=Eukaryota sp. BB2 TaxID=1949062 RepID=A0A1X8VEX3_9EUKA|nr:ribosomal protein L16 [Eukaryota sp. BB2]AQL10433.1 ribosomal protein L16 [Eukaryota sp. BB2]
MTMAKQYHFNSIKLFSYCENAHILQLSRNGGFKYSFPYTDIFLSFISNENNFVVAKKFLKYEFKRKSSLKKTDTNDLVFIQGNILGGNILQIISRTLFLRFRKQYFTEYGKKSTSYLFNCLNKITILLYELCKRELKISGIGYRFAIHLNLLVLKLGYSHLIFYLLPLTVRISRLGKSVISLVGLNNIIVSFTANYIKFFRLPSVYTSKGIRHRKETILSKQGKINQL